MMNKIATAINLFYKYAQQFDSFSEYLTKILQDFMLATFNSWAQEDQNTLSEILANNIAKYGLQITSVSVPVEIAISVDENKLYENFENSVNFLIKPSSKVIGTTAQNPATSPLPANFAGALVQELTPIMNSSLVAKLNKDVLRYKEAIESDMKQTGTPGLKVFKTIAQLNINPSIGNV